MAWQAPWKAAEPPAPPPPPHHRHGERPPHEVIFAALEHISSQLDDVREALRTLRTESR